MAVYSKRDVLYTLVSVSELFEKKKKRNVSKRAVQAGKFIRTARSGRRFKRRDN